MADDDSLIDMIYEAAFIPGVWREVIEKLAIRTESYGGSIFSVHAGGAGAIASQNCAQHLHDLLDDRWSNENVRARRLLERRHAGFLTDLDVCTSDEIETLPIYIDFLRPRGLGWTAATLVVGAMDDMSIFSIDRLHASGPFPRKSIHYLDGIRPHLARATMLSARLQMERCRGFLQGLDALNIAAAAVDARGRVRLTNSHFGAARSLLDVGAFDAIALADPTANALLGKAMSSLRAGNMNAAISIPVLSRQSGLPFALHVVPVRREARDLFSQVEAIVTVVPLGAPGLPFGLMVQHLYDLTPTEALTAKKLMEGASIQEIARLRGVGLETVRTQVKNILSKTGVSRQSALIARFSSLGRTPDE